jgi:hypothetical protein
MQTKLINKITNEQKDRALNRPQPKTNTDVEDPRDLNAQSEIQISKVRTEYGLNKERHACLKCKQCAIAH